MDCRGYKAHLRPAPSPVCPLCGVVVPIRRGEDIDARVDRHISEGCPKPFNVRVRLISKKQAQDEKLIDEKTPAVRASAAATAAAAAAGVGSPGIDMSEIWPTPENKDSHNTRDMKSNTIVPKVDLKSVSASFAPLSAQAARTQRILSRFVTQRTSTSGSIPSMSLSSSSTTKTSGGKGTSKLKLRELAEKHRKAYVVFQATQSRQTHWRAIVAAMVDHYMLQWSTALQHCREEDNARREQSTGGKRKRKRKTISAIHEAEEVDDVLRPLILPVCTCVKSVAEAMMMSDLDIAVWSMFLDKLQPDWISIRPPEAQLAALLYAGYSMKLLWCGVEEHQQLVPYLHRVQPDFTAKYIAWMRARRSVKFAIPPIELRRRYQRFQLCSKTIRNPFTHPDDFT
eukprot:CAMPEP_0167751176 /NCGR_PEP_ID=MMETSP0110_2-20121227/6413_1 /TAXON_ID=629695 /ORGANISM="Gymnochlora sp., Strain CCMP2014" /LENGTH=397 /DNA_ID=CAMNT_0007636603 /DNA_START=1371 /DNA_END=2564 /DNA_ORIENTATION=-